jgi:hypothetical protein
MAEIFYQNKQNEYLIKLAASWENFDFAPFYHVQGLAIVFASGSFFSTPFRIQGPS